MSFQNTIFDVIFLLKIWVSSPKPVHKNEEKNPQFKRYLKTVIGFFFWKITLKGLFFRILTFPTKYAWDYFETKSFLRTFSSHFITLYKVLKKIKMKKKKYVVQKKQLILFFILWYLVVVVVLIEVYRKILAHGCTVKYRYVPKCMSVTKF